MNTAGFPQATLSRYRCDLSHIQLLDMQAECELAQRWRDGDARAGQHLIEANLSYVLRIAFEYRRWGVPLEDLVQQGNLGLLHAASRYDADKGTRLAAYASYWIRAEIREYVVRMYRIVRLGTTRTERRAVRAFRSKTIHTVEELAQESGMPEARCQKLWPLLTRRDASLDPTPSHQDEEAWLAHPTADPETLACERQEQTLLAVAVQEALGSLSERERRILHARLMSDEPSTLEQLGGELGVSRERVRQLEKRARIKVRSALESVALTA